MVIGLLQQTHRVYEFYKLYIYNMDHAHHTLPLLIVTVKYHMARHQYITFHTVLQHMCNVSSYVLTCSKCFQLCLV